jgi:hypothetical protein
MRRVQQTADVRNQGAESIMLPGAQFARVEMASVFKADKTTRKL